ncbi:MAG TPA: hypothetical protein PLY89_07435, partial [Synergistaceae bacterium]|nr:hypothetical protein [Synergistaceae bacterium]
TGANAAAAAKQDMEEVAHAAEKVAEDAEELTHLASELNGLVAIFRTEESSVPRAALAAAPSRPAASGASPKPRPAAGTTPSRRK